MFFADLTSLKIRIILKPRTTEAAEEIGIPFAEFTCYYSEISPYDYNEIKDIPLLFKVFHLECEELENSFHVENYSEDVV